ncbi:MAG: baseplate J/gp47 family protein, partial [Patescibacteria group bacterium]|nr:baseplate J/gp47 family protein [Patescibacteria group bacterium]
IILLYVFAISAQVNIAITPKIVEDQSPVTLAVDGQSDFGSNQIAAKTVSQNEDGNLSQDTTGTKQVGTQAKGQVTIFSRLTQTTTLPKGTVLTASNNLNFTLDNDTTIASFSGDPSDPSTTIANVSVTAKSIGPEYNVPSGTKFTVSNQDSSNMSAKNDNPFSGGTKKDISVVAQADVDKLVSTLTKNLESQATSDMKKTLSDTQQLLPFFAQEQVVSKKLSSNVGDEAKSVSLTATIAYEGISVDKNDLISFAKQVLKDKLTADADMTNSKLDTNLTDTKQDKNTISGTLAIKASILPKIDTSQITKDISGKSFDQAETLIKNMPQVSGVNIQLKPNVPLLPKILP